MTFTDDEAELRLICLQIAKELTDNANTAIWAAEKFVSFINGELDNKTE